MRTSAPRLLQHVAKRAKDNTGCTCDLNGLIDRFDRCDANGTARTVHDANGVGQELIDTVTQDGMGLASTDLHDRPRASRLSSDLLN